MIRGVNGPISRIERVALIVSLLLAAALMWPVRGYLTDDTFIQLQYARHIAGGQGFVFNPGERIYGCTSPLWVALIADGIALGFDGLGTARAIGFVATLWSVALFMQLMRRNLRTPELRALATIAWAGHAWMARWSLSGMETPLAVALTLAGFVAYTEGLQWGSRPVRTGALWALAALTRPEAVFLLLLWGVFLVAETENRPGLRRLLFGVVPPTLIYGGWLLFARFYFGTFWPQTLSAKAAGGGGTAFAIESLRRQAGIVGATDGVLLATLALALLLGVRRIWPQRVLAQRLLPWAWLLSLPLLYVARGVSVLTRYLLPLLPVLAWLTWRAVERWWAGDEPRPEGTRRAVRFGALLCVLVLGQNLVAYGRLVLPQVHSFTAGLKSSLIPWGQWFGRHTHPEDAIASPDIGAIGYFSQRRVVDLAGLITPAMVPLLDRESPEAAIANFDFASIARPEYLVDRAAAPLDLMRRSRFAPCLTPIGDATVPNLGIARPGVAVYSFYRVDWARYDSLKAARD